MYRYRLHHLRLSWAKPCFSLSPTHKESRVILIYKNCSFLFERSKIQNLDLVKLFGLESVVIIEKHGALHLLKRVRRPSTFDAEPEIYYDTVQQINKK